MKKTESISIAPTWIWVANTYLAIKGNHPMAAKGFREELERISPQMRSAIRRGDHAMIKVLAVEADSKVKSDD